MNNNGEERRRETRLRYHWPVWFAEDFGDDLNQGQMVDVSSGGAAFTCHADTTCPYPGQKLTARFSVPRIANDDGFDMTSFTCHAEVCRVDEVNSFLRRVAVQFASPLPFKPGEQVEDEQEAQQRLKAVTV
ncbi:MAG: PilZ domain-containing protein [Planctomycetota bacterium]